MNEEMVDPENYCTQANREVYFYNCLHGKQEFSEHRVPFVFGNDFHTGKWVDPDDPSFWEIWIDVPVFEHANFRYYRRYYGYNPDDYTDGSHFIAKFPQYAGKVIPFLHYWKLFEPEKYQEVMTDLIVLDPEKYIHHECWDKLSGDQWSEILKKAPEYEYKLAVDHFSDQDWYDLLSGCPVLADKYNISCIRDGKIIDKLLKQYPQWADRFDWENVYSWEYLLAHQPQLIDKASAENLYFDKNYSAWWRILEAQPQLAAKCPYKLSVNGEHIYYAKDALEKHPELSTLIDWRGAKYDEEFLPELCRCKTDKNLLLSLVKDFIVAKAWDLSNVRGQEWTILLTLYPCLAEHCDWLTLRGSDWCNLLLKQPQFAVHCDWSELNGANWSWFISQRPLFSAYCDWSKLNGFDWRILLSAQPQFAEHCDWKKLDGGNWASLLSNQPQFAEQCDSDKLNPEDLLCLRDFQPELVKHILRCKKLNKETLSSVLFTCPEFADKVDLSQMNGMDLVTLFYNQPQIFENRNLADLCRWEDLHGLFWCKFLSEYPEYAAYCDWNKLTEEHWPELLFFQPQFADRCDWSELLGEHIKLLLQEHPQLEKYCQAKWRG